MNDKVFINIAKANDAKFNFWVVNWDPKSSSGHKIPHVFWKKTHKIDPSKQWRLINADQGSRHDIENITAVSLSQKTEFSHDQILMGYRPLFPDHPLVADHPLLKYAAYNETKKFKEGIKDIGKQYAFRVDPSDGVDYSKLTASKDLYHIGSNDHTPCNLAVMVDGYHRFRINDTHDTRYYQFQSDIDCTLLTYDCTLSKSVAPQENQDLFKRQLVASIAHLGKVITKELPATGAAPMGESFNMILPYGYDESYGQSFPSKHLCVQGLPIQAIQWDGNKEHVLSFDCAITSVIVSFKPFYDTPLYTTHMASVFAFGADWMSKEFKLSDIIAAFKVEAVSSEGIIVPALHLNHWQFRQCMVKACEKIGQTLNQLQSIERIEVHFDVVLKTRTKSGELLDCKPVTSSVIGFVPQSA